MTESDYIPAPILNGFHPGVRLAGYEIAGSPIQRSSFLLIPGEAKGRLPVMMKIARSDDRTVSKRSKREALFLSRACSVTPFVPRLVDSLSVPLAVDDSHMARLADPSAPHTEFNLLVMEKIPGVTLDDFVKNGPISESFLTEGLLSVALGIDAFGIDENIVHRDLKPSNIIITPDKKGKIIDFDIAVDVGEGINEKGDFYWGTLSYSPNEQRRKNTTLDHKSNVWGFGALLTFGFDAEDLLLPGPDYLETEELYNSYLDLRLNHFTVPVQDVIRRATAYRAGDRYDSCTEVLVDFKRAIHHPEETIIYQNALLVKKQKKHLSLSKALATLIKGIGGV